MKRRLMCIIMVMVLLISSLGVMNVNAATSGAYEYEMYTDNTVMITKYTGGAASELTIPEKIKGYPVVAIGEEAFMNAELYKINLPSTLEYIADFAFWNTAISSITIPKNVSHIGIGAFSGGLFTTYYVDSENEYFTFKDNVLFNKEKTALLSFPSAREYTWINLSYDYIAPYAFMSAFNLGSMTIPKSVSYIGEGAFAYSSISSVSFPATVDYVDDYAFGYCEQLKYVTVAYGEGSFSPCAFEGSAWFDSQPDGMIYFGRIAYLYKGTAPSEVALKEDTMRLNGKAFAGQTEVVSITLPKDIRAIDYSAFDQCSSLKSIIIDPTPGRYYTTIDGMLYNKEQTELYVCPAGKTGVVNIPEGTELIEEYAFEYCEKVTEIVIPDTVTVIEDGAFFGCSSLEKIVVPDSVERVGNYLFYECTNLADITIPEGFVLLYSYDFIDTAWYEAQPEGLLYLCKNLIGHKGEYEELTEVEVAEGTLSISDLAFFGYDKIISVKIPDSVKVIGNWAFENCPEIKEVFVPASVDEIGQFAFGYTYSYNEETDDESEFPVEGFVIKGYKNTKAEEYANEHGFKFEEVSQLLGDSDLDGVITIKDATAIQKYLASLQLFVTQQKINADMNGDGSVDIKDATAIQKYLAGLK